ncbi:hypothetical protein EN811_26190, partial [bacterium M00.F.Ca.ET.168.01.1.1]
MMTFGLAKPVAETAAISRARAFTALGDLSARPAAEVADALPAAAAWLSSMTEEETGVGESRWAELAYRLLTGAVAADSGSDNGLTGKLKPCGGVLQPPPTGDQGMAQPAPEEGNMPVIKPGEVPP